MKPIFVNSAMWAATALGFGQSNNCDGLDFAASAFGTNYPRAGVTQATPGWQSGSWETENGVTSK
jgi:hypothetical protein